MSDNAKNGIIDLTEIVEMGTPPEQVAEPAPAGQSAVVDFDKELEDLFSSDDLSEFADFGEDTTMAAPEPVVDTPPVTAHPVSTHPASASDDLQDVDDFLGDLAGSLSDVDITLESAPAEPVAPSAPAAPVADALPDLGSDIGDLLDSVDGGDDTFGFDADFEDLLNDLSDSQPSQPASPVQSAQPVQPAKQAQPTQPVQQAPTFETDLSDLEADLSSASLEIPEPEQAVKAPEFSTTDEADTFLDDLAHELDSISLDAPAPSPVAPEPVAPEPVVSAPKPEPKPAPKASASPVFPVGDPNKEISLDDPFDVDSILNEFSEDVELAPEPAQAPAAVDDTFDLSDIDDLLKGPDDGAPRREFSAADGESLSNEDVEMDDLGFLLSELDEDGVEYGMPASAVFDEQKKSVDEAPDFSSVADMAAEPAAVAEPKSAVVSEPEEFVSDNFAEAQVAPEAPAASAQPVDPSLFDADIDALLDDLEMASSTAEPAAEKAEPEAAPAPEATPEPAVAATPEPEPVSEIDPIEALLAEQAAKDAAPEVPVAEEPSFEAPSFEEPAFEEPSIDDLLTEFSAEPVIEEAAPAPEATPEPAVATTPEPEPVSEIDPIEALLAEQAAKDAAPEVPVAEEPSFEAPSFEEPAFEEPSIDDLLTEFSAEPVIEEAAPAPEATPEPAVAATPEPEPVSEIDPIEALLAEQAAKDAVPEAPIAEEPSFEAPSFDEPSFDEPAFEEPSIDDLLNEFSADPVIEEAAPAPEATPEPAVATTPEPEPVSEIDPIEALLAEQVAKDAAPAPEATPEPAVAATPEPEPVSEIDPIEALLAEQAAKDAAPEAPIAEEPSFEAPSFDEPSFEEPAFEEPSIDDLLTEFSAEPVIEEAAPAPEATPEQAVAATPEPEPVSEIDPIEALLAEQAAKDAAPEAPVAEEPSFEAPSFDDVVIDDALTDSVAEPVEDDIASELEAFLEEGAQPEVIDDVMSEVAPEPEQASPLGSSDEFESILDELDSLLEKQGIAPAPEPTEPASEALDDSLIDVEENVQPEVEEPIDLAESNAADLDLPDLSFDPDPEPVLDIPDLADEVQESELPEAPSEAPALSLEQDAAEEQEVEDGLGESSTHEEDLGAALDKILGEDPIAASELPELVLEPAEEPVEISHDDLEEMFEEPEADVADVADVDQDISVAESSVDHAEDMAPVQEASDPLEDESESEFENASVDDVAQEALAELKSLASEIEMSPVEESIESGSSLDMDAINDDAAPVPPDASIEDLMNQAKVAAPKFTPESVEILDTMPAVDSNDHQKDALDVVPEPVMTPEEFAELTERIYHLENSLKQVVEQAERQKQAMPKVEKPMLVSAIDEAFNIDGPLMARVLGAMEVRTESMIDSMGAKIEKQMRNSIEAAAAKSAAQLIREELQALLAEDNK